jgi:hypothetical protein
MVLGSAKTPKTSIRMIIMGGNAKLEKNEVAAAIRNGSFFRNTR